MAKEPNTPTSGAQPPDPEDARAEFWEATFFNPDGTEVSEQRSTAERAPSADETQPKARPDSTASSATEKDGKLQQHTSREAHVSADQHAEELGEAMHAKFMHLLNAKMKETDGHLTAEDVEEMGEEFRENLEEIKTAFVSAAAYAVCLITIANKQCLLLVVKF